MAAATISAAVKVPVTSRVEPAAEAAQTKAVAPTTIFLSRTKLVGKVQSRRVPLRRRNLSPIFASTTESSAANSLADSVVPEVAALEDVPDDAPKKKTSPLARGGTLDGTAAAGKDPAASTLGKSAIVIGKFSDPRWISGTWDLTQFMKDGKPDWDAVIDAEVVRRKWLEDNPQTSSNEDPVFFETGSVPWWAWTKRFHLPEAERLNGRAAMLGFFAAYLVDAATGVGLVDQMGSFFGKLLLFVTIVGTLLIRKNEDLDNIKNLADEWTFYDKQWQASWKDTPRPSEASKESDVAKP